MKSCLYFIVATAFLSDYGKLIEATGILGKILKFSPELASGFLLILILFNIGYHKRFVLSPKYVFLGMIFTAHIVAGLILNAVAPGTIVSGLRVYLKFVPLFLLPAVYDFSEEELRRFFRFVLLMLIAQLPVSLYQRLVIFPVVPTGDVVSGMFPNGAVMSIVLVSTLTILFALYVRGQLSRAVLLILIPTLFIPTLINETKGTVVLLPIALVALAFLQTSGAKRLRSIAAMIFASTIFIGTFAIAYDIFFPNQFGGMGLISFFEERAIEQTYKQQEEPEIGKVGRIDSIVFAASNLSEDTTKMVFGLGAGNVSHPDRPEILLGEFSEYYFKYGAYLTTYGHLLWEIGYLGILLVLALLGILYGDSRLLSKEAGHLGALALGWSAVLVMMPVAFIYKSLVNPSAVGVLGLFISGLIATKAYKVRHSVIRSE